MFNFSGFEKLAKAYVWYGLVFRFGIFDLDFVSKVFAFIAFGRELKDFVDFLEMEFFCLIAHSCRLGLWWLYDLRIARADFLDFYPFD